MRIVDAVAAGVLGGARSAGMTHTPEHPYITPAIATSDLRDTSESKISAPPVIETAFVASNRAIRRATGENDIPSVLPADHETVAIVEAYFENRRHLERSIGKFVL